MTNTERTYRLLVVDDDEADRRLYQRLLARHVLGACEIHHTADGTAGLAALRAQQFDCVLLDFSLPDMTGLEFLANAVVDAAGEANATGRADAAGGGHNELPCTVVLVTGHGSEAIAVEVMKRGVCDYLVKDQIDASRLWHAIAGAVNQTELRQRLAVSLRDLTLANTALDREVANRKDAEAELRTAKEAAEQANQAKTRFVAMITHELRTPLNGILGYAQLLRIEGGLTARQTARIEAMTAAGHQLLELIEPVLDFARIEAGRMELNLLPVAVHDVIDGCVRLIGPIATERALNLCVVSSHNAPQQIVTDPSRVRQVLLNLLGNAVKYTTAGSVELRVLAGAVPDRLRIEVADTGPGVADAVRDRLFQYFERLDPTSSVEGAGLGLAIAARIVGLLGGTIGHAANPGGGSVFWLELPPAELASPAPACPMVSVRSLPPSGQRVLLVDDIDMNRDVIGAFLHAAGHEVLLASDGKEAVQRAFEQAFDLILMDVRMPEMDGLEATRLIRALPGRAGRVPIVALTAYSFPDQVAQCREAGMDGHVTKPVDYAVLMHAIADAIAGVPASWAINLAAVPGAAETAGEPMPVTLDRRTLDQMLAFLSPEEAAVHLESLRTRIGDMVVLLDQSAALAQMTEAVHTLASAAGMFGFAALCMVARNLEHALANDASDADPLRRLLCVEIRRAQVRLDELICENQMQLA
jgi:signal transduction histidine kinase/HPt (histidine-containing phosphotransfer) domain-containing protein